MWCMSLLAWEECNMVHVITVRWSMSLLMPGEECNMVYGITNGEGV